MTQTKNSTILYTNEQAAAYEMAAVETALQDAKAVKNYLTDKGALCTPQTIEQACRKTFDTIVDNFLDIEKRKLAEFEEKFGILALISGNSEGRLQAAAEKLRSDLLAGLPTFDYFSPNYWQCIDFESMSIKPEFNMQYFEHKNSIVVPTEAAKHQSNLFNALTYFMEKRPNWSLEVIVNRLVKRKELFGRDIEMSLEAFDFDGKVRNKYSELINEKGNSQLKNRY